jgi:enoyl-CoA hydratase
MREASLLLEIDCALATITFNNPRVHNALTVAAFLELEALLAELERNIAVRVLILTGAGDKAFVAGGDIGHLATLDADSARQFALLAQRVIDRIEAFPKPVIAAINGYALGGGCELAMGCDLRIAADTAKFGQPEVKLGIIPGFAGTQRLVRLVGKGKAKELIFTGEMIDAEEACRIGLVNRVVAKDQLMAEARALALLMCNKSASAIKLAKEAIDIGVEMDFARGARYEADLFALCFTTTDCKEGISAFLEKRSARF